MILNILWLVAHNPEIDWEKGEVKMIRCPPIYRKRKQKQEMQGRKQVRKTEKEKTVEELVPRRF